jgi:hypothetical protein
MPCTVGRTAIELGFTFLERRWLFSKNGSSVGGGDGGRISRGLVHSQRKTLDFGLREFRQGHCASDFHNLYWFFRFFSLGDLNRRKRRKGRIGGVRSGGGEVVLLVMGAPLCRECSAFCHPLHVRAVATLAAGEAVAVLHGISQR